MTQSSEVMFHMFEILEISSKRNFVQKQKRGLCNYLMCSLHEVHKKLVQWEGSVCSCICPSVCIFKTTQSFD